MFAGKFVIENLEQHVTVSCANVIVVGDSNHEFEANEILISVPHCMFHVIVSREPKECGESTYFEAGVRVKDAPEDDDEFEILEESVVEVLKKNE
ncbi:15414_t:CDS:2, partial [Gigaspora rosea]